MGMGTMGSLPPPPAVNTTPEFGNPPAQVTPAPAQPPSPAAMQVINDVHSILASSRNIAEQFPATVPIVRQINDLVQQLQMAIVQALPPTEVAAPPV